MSYREQDNRNNSTEKKSEEEALLRKAELLIELRGYEKEKLHKSEDWIDIKAKSTSDETTLIRIITNSNLKSNAVGVKKAGETKRILEEANIDNVIIFGKRFTKAARKELQEDDIEFFSEKQGIVSTLNQQELYSKIRDSVDALCQIKCGHIPETESECEGYSESPVECAHCAGTGRVKGSYREYECPICGGKGSSKRHYSCRVRLLSDNADFHFERGWINLLKSDILSLITILRDIKTEPEEHFPLPLIHSSSTTASVRRREMR